jgi:hypothetical protein
LRAPYFLASMYLACVGRRRHLVVAFGILAD